jgi:metal transporter CNNM
MDLFLSITLILSSGFFSGLTIGLMGLSTSEVKRLSHLGNIEATKILRVLKDKHLLLVTLLLGNTAVNATLAIFLGTLVGAGFAAGLLSTFLILIFGEIIPASLLSRHALKVGAISSPIVMFLMKLFYPISKPIAFILDKYIGEELESYLSRGELIYILKEQAKAKETDIDEQDSRLITGVLTLTNKLVHEHMRKRTEIMAITEDSILNKETFNLIKEYKHSKLPIINKSGEVISIVNLKDIISIDSSENRKISEFMKDDFLRVSKNDFLDDVLSKMIEEKVGIAIVYGEFSDFDGFITLKDVLDEILLKEIHSEY